MEHQVGGLKSQVDNVTSKVNILPKPKKREAKISVILIHFDVFNLVSRGQFLGTKKINIHHIPKPFNLINLS